MSRLLGLVVLGFLMWLALETLLDRARGAFSGRPRPGAMPRRERPAAAETLVRCAGCGVYVPRSRARVAAGEAGAAGGGAPAAGDDLVCERCAGKP